MSKSKPGFIKAIEIFRQLATIFINQGYSLYLVGGSVRDLVLNREIQDLDMTTDAHPEAVYRILIEEGRSLHTIGIEYGTIGFQLEGYMCEITTMRVEGNYEDGRHPIDVLFTTELNKDLVRRDFTMNAMALSLDNLVIDPMGGQNDLKKGLLKAVGDPEMRFNEDGIRILRAIRMKTMFNLAYDKGLDKAMHNQMTQLQRLPIERVRQEVEKGFKTREGLAMILELLKWECFQTLHPTLFGGPGMGSGKCDFEVELSWIRQVNMQNAWALTTIKNRQELGWILLGYVFKNKVETERFYQFYGMSKKRIDVWNELHTFLKSLSQMSVMEWTELGHVEGRVGETARFYWLKMLSGVMKKERSLLIDIILLSASSKMNEQAVKTLKERLINLCHLYPMDWQSMTIEPKEMEILKNECVHLNAFGHAVKQLKIDKRHEVWKKDMEKEMMETYNRKGTTGK